MCGIVGIVSADEVAPLLVKSIARLEYRGYDSCGVATLDSSGIEVRKDAGAVEEVAAGRGWPALAGRWASRTPGGQLTAECRRRTPTRTLAATEALRSCTMGSSRITGFFELRSHAKVIGSRQGPIPKWSRICWKKCISLASLWKRRS
jgi:hypothetical protein